jgi:hypothetical protein
MAKSTAEEDGRVLETLTSKILNRISEIIKLLNEKAFEDIKAFSMNRYIVDKNDKRFHKAVYGEITKQCMARLFIGDKIKKVVFACYQY